MKDTESERSGASSDVSKAIHIGYTDPSTQLSKKGDGRVSLDLLGVDPLGPDHDVEKTHKLMV